MNISTSPLKEALHRLEVNFSLAETIDGTADLKLALKTASIQSFEYTYAVATKLIERYLQNIDANAEEVEHMSFRALMRTAAEKGLISDPVIWFAFREKRNITSHTYTEEKAVEVFLILPAFIKAARELLDQVEKALHAS